MSEPALDLQLEGQLADTITDLPPVGARLRMGVVDAVVAASGNDRATIEVDGLPIPYLASYSPAVSDVAVWIEDGQRRVAIGKLT